jgi:Flagellar hook-length control protein FliK
MAISVTPTLPVITPQGAVPAVVLQPGTVISAQVLKILAGDLVQIAIADLSIEVMSQVPLQAGQTLQLAVSQTQDGIRLAIVGPGADTAADSTPTDTVNLAPGATLAPPALAGTPTNTSVTAAAPINPLTPLERSAVSAAAQTAVTQQESLAPLFANLGVAASSGGLPPALQQAVAQVLAQRPSLDQNLTGSDVKNAFEGSGLFLEASLASGSVSTASGVPDLKAALIVLRQTLLASLGANDSPAGSAAVAPQSVLPATAEISASDQGSVPHTAGAPALAPSPSPDVDLQEIAVPQIVSSAAFLNAGTRAATTGAALNLLQEVLQEVPREIGNASLALGTPNDVRNDDVTVHTNTPPPPFRGALPSAQPVASPSIAPGATLATSVRHLLDNTDAAIARQTLLQVASLPGQADTAAARLDPAVPRWNFEIPFVTPQGTAMAQFEISRDGGAASEAEAARQAWRARFTLDVEPAGPVHALVSLSGDRTSVRMWAERPATADQLRAGVAQLSQVLSRAELQPGDIVIRDGAPLQPVSAKAGHFLDRAL